MWNDIYKTYRTSMLLTNLTGCRSFRREPVLLSYVILCLCSIRSDLLSTCAYLTCVRCTSIAWKYNSLIIRRPGVAGNQESQQHQRNLIVTVIAGWCSMTARRIELTPQKSTCGSPLWSGHPRREPRFFAKNTSQQTINHNQPNITKHNNQTSWRVQKAKTWVKSAYPAKLASFPNTSGRNVTNEYINGKSTAVFARGSSCLTTFPRQGLCNSLPDGKTILWIRQGVQTRHPKQNTVGMCWSWELLCGILD